MSAAQDPQLMELLVDKKIAAGFRQQFVEKAKRLKLGNGLDHQTQMGPLMSAQQREKIIAYVEKGKREGARLLEGRAAALVETDSHQGHGNAQG